MIISLLFPTCKLLSLVTDTFLPNQGLNSLFIFTTNFLKLIFILNSDSSSSTGAHHPPQHPPQRRILERGRDPLLVGQLLRHRLAAGVRAALDLDADAKAGRQGLFEAHAHGEPDHGRERAVRDGGGDEHGGFRDWFRGGRGRCRRRRWRR